MFLSFHQTKLLRKYVNEETEYSHKYFATMTWSKEEQARMDAIIVSEDGILVQAERTMALLKWRENQCLSFLRHVARKQNIHFSVLLSFELAENPHAHAIVMSHQKIDCRLWNKEWRHGAEREIKQYNPTMGKTENGVVGYVMGTGNRYSFPPKHRAKGNTRVFCPMKKRRCKNGNCLHKHHFQQQLHHVIHLSDQEEAQMEQEWIAAGAWDLQQWNNKEHIRKSQSSVKPKTSQNPEQPGEKRLIGRGLHYSDYEAQQQPGVKN
jgi:hypothetical protein